MNTKDKALKLFLSGEKITIIAKKLNVKRQTIYLWRTKYKWLQKLKQVENNVSENLVNETSTSRTEILKGIQSIQQRALQDLKRMRPKTFYEGAKVFMDAVKLQMEISPIEVEPVDKNKLLQERKKELMEFLLNSGQSNEPVKTINLN